MSVGSGAPTVLYGSPTLSVVVENAAPNSFLPDGASFARAVLFDLVPGGGSPPL